MASLQKELKLKLLVTLLLVMVGLLFLIDRGVQKLTEDYILTRLQHDAESVIAALDIQQQDWQIQPGKVSTIYQRVNSGHYYVVFNDSSELRSRSLWDYTPSLIPLDTGSTLIQRVVGLEGQQWLSFSQGIRLNNQSATIWIAEDITPLNNDIFYYRLWAMGLLLFALFILMLVQHRVLTRTFSRLTPLRAMIRELRFGSADFQSLDIPSEIQPLVEEINRLLEQLEKRVARSRNAVGNLAHDLKRPLQSLQSATEQLPEALQEVPQQALQELRYKIERELKRARIVGVSSPGRQTVLDNELPPLVEVLQRLYPSCRISYAVPSNATLPQDRDDILELLGNLLDNACKYAGGHVQLKIEFDSNNWEIYVSDDGPGIGTELSQRILQRGVRLDESAEGHGLGLAICQDIVDSYGGSLQLQSNTPHGLCVHIVLPEQTGLSETDS